MIRVYKVVDMSGFKNGVFGSEYFIKYFPEITDTGIPLLELNGCFYVIDDAGIRVNDTAFFTIDEMIYLSEVGHMV